MYPHPAPDGWPFPIWKDYPYKAPVKPLEESPW